MKTTILLSVFAILVSTNTIAQQDTIYKLKDGSEVKLPLKYDNWTWIMATFSISYEQAKELLPDSLEPVLFSKGEALISFGAYKYPDVIGLEPYNEFLVSIPVQYGKKSGDKDARKNNPMFPNEAYSFNGSYIYYLPVTTEESFKAGSEIWGFPKVHRKMVFEETEETIKCSLLDNDSLEMVIVIDKIPISKKKKDFSYCSYTLKPNELHYTCIDANGNYGIKYKGINASVTFEGGLISSKLKGLKLSEKPIQIFYATNVSSSLPLAQKTFKSNSIPPINE